MSKLTRLFHKVFGGSANFSYQMGKFGSFKNGNPEYAADAEEIQSLSNFDEGLYGAVVANNAPMIQDINGALHHSSRQIGYLFQQGISEWDSSTTYYIGSVVTYNGTVYISKTDSNVTTPSSVYGVATNWEAIYGSKKTFVNPVFNAFSSAVISSPAYSSLNAASIVYNSIAYLVGGNDVGSNPNNIVQRCPISAGTLGAWAGQMGYLATPTSRSAVIVHKGKIYVLGGRSAAGITNVTQYSDINLDGTINTFTAGNNLSESLEYTSAFISGNKVFLCGANSAHVLMATLNTNGTIGTWSTHNSLAHTETGATKFVVIGKYAYLIGEHLQKAYIYFDNTLSAWEDLGACISGTPSAVNIFITGRVLYIQPKGTTFPLMSYVINEDDSLTARASVQFLTGEGADAIYPTALYTNFINQINGCVSNNDSKQYTYIDKDNDSSINLPQAGFCSDGGYSSYSTFQKYGCAPWLVNQ